MKKRLNYYQVHKNKKPKVKKGKYYKLIKSLKQVAIMAFSFNKSIGRVRLVLKISIRNENIKH